MAHEAAKTVREGDPEVSEAIDLLGAASTHTLDELAAEGVEVEPLGVVLVAGPWNFPTAIPANGAVGALAAGNACSSSRPRRSSPRPSSSSATSTRAACPRTSCSSCAAR